MSVHTANGAGQHCADRIRAAEWPKPSNPENFGIKVAVAGAVFSSVAAITVLSLSALLLERTYRHIRPLALKWELDAGLL